MPKSKIIRYGNYFLTRKIATGGMAEIFRARKVGAAGFEKLLIVKRLLPHVASNHDFINMFLDEARLASQLTHQNIVQVYDLGRVPATESGDTEAEDTYFIAMEYVFGKNLAEVIKKGREQGLHLTGENIIKIIYSAGVALNYAHHKKGVDNRALDIVHRDVSPQNILLSYEGETKLVDFGIAKALSQSTATQPGVLKGKFTYMSPEQARGDKVGPASDIYALGIVMWEALTRQRLFAADSEAAILAKVLEPNVPPPSSAAPEVAPELDAICLKCLSRDPADRYQSGEELANELEKYLISLGTYPSTYSIRNIMHQLFAERIAEETEQMQEELEEVRSLTASPSRGKTTVMGTKVYTPAEEEQEAAPEASPPPPPPPEAGAAGKGNLVKVVGGALAALVIVVASFFLFSGSEETPTPTNASVPASTQTEEKAPPAEPQGEPPRSEAQADRVADLKTQVEGMLEGRQFAEALKALDQAVQDDQALAGPLSGLRARALVGLARGEMDTKPQEALDRLAQATRLAPDWYEAHFQLGRIQTRLKNFDAALAAYQRALELKKDLGGAYFNMGYIFLQQNRVPEAIKAYKKVAELDANLAPEAYLNLGVSYARLGDRDQAIGMLEKTLEVQPDNALAKQYLQQLRAGGESGG